MREIILERRRAAVPHRHSLLSLSCPCTSPSDMSHKSKSKAKGISATSFFDLKSELSKQEADFAKAKASGKSTSIVGGVKRPDKA